MASKIGVIPLAFITAFIAGLLNLFSKSLLNAGLAPIDVGVIRETGTAIMFALILLVFDRDAFKVNIRDIPLFLLFALFNIISNLAMFSAMQHLPMGMASVLQMTSPYFVLILSLLLFGIKITSRKVLACVVAFIGCTLIVGLFNGDGHICVEGVLLAVLSAVTLAAFTIGGRFLSNRGYSENTSMMYFFGLSGLMMLPLADFGKITGVLSSDISLVFDAVCLCFICTLVVNFLIIYTTCRMDPGVFSIILSSSIVVSTIFGIVFFNESLALEGAIGIVLVLIAMVILESESIFGKDKKTDDAL